MHEKSVAGVRMVIAGSEKMGKTTLACSAPRPLLIPLEIGYAGISVSRVALLENYAHVEMLLDEIIVQVQQGQCPYKTIIFDSATALERLLHDSIITIDPNYTVGNKKAVTMETVLGGYGKGYTYANEKFTTLLSKCDWLATVGLINIVFTCHTFASKLVDPLSGEYDSWDLLLHSPKNQRTYGKREIITQWADVIGYLYEPMFVSKAEGATMTKAVSVNKGRVLGVTRTPSYVAGNRYGIDTEIVIPKEQGWNAFAQSLHQCSGVDVFNRDV